MWADKTRKISFQLLDLDRILVEIQTECFKVHGAGWVANAFVRTSEVQSTFSRHLSTGDIISKLELKRTSPTEPSTEATGSTVGLMVDFIQDFGDAVSQRLCWEN